MTNSRAARGERRRAELIDAGIAVLAEQGWAGLTHRAVAARAEANPGLVHYYFKGSAGLRSAVAERIVRESITAMFDDLVTVDDPGALFDGLARRLVEVQGDDRAARVTAAVVSAAYEDPMIGALVGAALADGRARVEQWLSRQNPARGQHFSGKATLLVAAIDGLVLHRLIDPSIPADDITAAVTALRQLTGTDSARRADESH
ncbi:TetR/AcrR family transcriptional regulator [Nocardia transvalensis]|uniref:TetR/AcrR family transcriptional regulator n=1 Tax=Nocardia transvalensis TaxID=37333 RepID=UPI001895F479|nr:TetR/AcrR family transcriptional regulator [Nocardia transvalensis]MBF6331732.1 TetR/AcrR family transcriptional regulator [Nocardia transvalensis]